MTMRLRIVATSLDPLQRQLRINELNPEVGVSLIFEAEVIERLDDLR